jgi:hypothetical protein
MKKLLLTAAAVLATLTSYGQFSGIVNYNSGGASNQFRVWVNTSGQPLDGQLAAGTSYQTALFWGVAGSTDAAALTQIGGNVNFLTGAAAGTFFGSGRTLTYTSPAANGAVVALQSRAWAVEPGVTGWDNARLKGSGPIFDLDLKDPTVATEPTPTISQAAGWRGYGIVVPEPSAIALGVLGAGALLMLRRRK